MKKFFLSLLMLGLFTTSGYSVSNEGYAQEIYSKIKSIYLEYKNQSEGTLANYIPELARVNPDLFAIVIAKVNGEVIGIGDVDVPFAIESISKPFVYGLALLDQGREKIFQKIGLNATGEEFNSLSAIEHKPNHLQNPYVNAGAIQTTSFIKGKNSQEKFARVLEFFSQLSAANVNYNKTIYQSESSSNTRNRAIEKLMNKYRLLNDDPEDALDRYTKTCSIMLTAKQLAMMGATLANDGKKPNH